MSTRGRDFDFETDSIVLDRPPQSLRKTGLVASAKNQRHPSGFGERKSRTKSCPTFGHPVTKKNHH